MRSRPRPSLPLALSALLLCASHRPAGSSSAAASTAPWKERSTETLGSSQQGPRQTDVSSNSGHRSQDSGSSPPETREATSPEDGSTFSTVTYGVSDRAPSWGPGGGVSPLCAYRVIEGGIGGRLCFRHTLPAYTCHGGDCRTAVSAGNLVANILANGSVLLQWGHEGGSAGSGRPGTRVRGGERARPSPSAVSGGRRRGRGGYELSCRWYGTYAQFECAGARLGSGCGDFLLAELHENTRYRVCLRSLARVEPAPGADRRHCVDFSMPPSGMRDIVIAMTAVGGAICLMLVIICLLVAYITENVMSPPVRRPAVRRPRAHLRR